MSETLEKAQSHFRSLMAGGLTEIHVPEWDGMSIFVKPQTPRDIERLAEMEKPHLGNIGELMAVKLIHYAMDKDGEPLLKYAELSEIVNGVSFDVLSDVLQRINLMTPTIEQAEKNSEPTPS